MAQSPYSRFEDHDRVLRDELVIDRTILANERTLLAYLRSGVALIIAGVSIMHFAEANWLWIVGVTCIPFGFGTSLVGMNRHRRMSKAINGVRGQFESAHPEAEIPDE